MSVNRLLVRTGFSIQETRVQTDGMTMAELDDVPVQHALAAFRMLTAEQQARFLGIVAAGHHHRVPMLALKR